MNVVFVFLIILIVTVIILILVHKSGKFNGPDSVPKGVQTQENYNSNKPINQFTPSPVWGAPTGFGANGAIECSTYTFIGYPFAPATPSYNTLNSGARGYYIDRANNPTSCIDVDQLYAAQVKTTCTNPQGSSAGAGCILSVPTSLGPGTGPPKQPGEYVPKGTVQGDYQTNPDSWPLYSQCTPTNVVTNPNNGSNYCVGNIGVIIPYFTPQQQYDTTPSPNNCLSGLVAENITGQVTFDVDLQNCDLSEPSQIFRMVRYTATIDDDNNKIVLTQDDQGPLAAIVHRYSGYYLAPELTTAIEPGTTGTLEYMFDQPIYQPYGSYTDLYGNNFKTYVKLKLINPSLDLDRGGVYWLLQNQTFSNQYSNDDAILSSFIGYGIYPNQTNYNAQYPEKTAPTMPSYWTQQVAVKYCAGSSGPGPFACPPATDLMTGGNQLCYFKSKVPSNTGNGVGTVPDAEADIAPQQIVYVPDLRLLPNGNDPASIWSYLVNQYSINLLAGSNEPVLAPYRQTSKVDLFYTCRADTTDSGNYFTELLGVLSSKNSLSDTQFINYSLYVPQIQTGVSKTKLNDQGTYAAKSNPFNN